MCGAVLLGAALAMHGDPFELLTDPARVRAEAVDSLIEELGGDPKKGREAAVRLVRFGRHAVPALTKALESPRLQVRFYAASALDLIRDPAATEALYRLMLKEKEEPSLRKIAARALGRAEYKPAVPILLETVRGRRVAREGAPSGAGAPPGGDGVLKDSPLALDEDFRFEVIRALSYIGDLSSAQVLIEALQDDSPRIRDAAAQGLGDQRMPGAIDGLRKLLADEEGPVAASAACALGKYGGAAAAAVGELIEALERPDVRVQRAAKGALVVITGFAFSTAERWRDWWKTRLERGPELDGSPTDADAPRPVPSPARAAPPAKAGAARTGGEGADGVPPALRPPWEWDGDDWR